MRAPYVSRALGMASLACCLIASGANAGVTGPLGVDIDGYELVGSVRLSRTQFELTYRANLVNQSPDASFAATLSTTASSIVVVEGALTFGDVFEGGTVQSGDTFTIRVDRGAPFDKDRLDWLVAATPLPPTTFELIDAALAASQIDNETSLIYKTYDTYNDPRLPAEYRGRDDGFIDNPIIAEVRSQFPSLSLQSQEILAPFLKSAIEPGSWQELRLAAEGFSAAGLTSPSAPAPPPAGPQAVDTANGQVRIWWYPQRPQDEARAIAFANEIDNYLWQKLTSAFRSPAPDLVELTPGGPVFFGTDARLDIVLTDTARAETITTLLVCDGRPSGARIELGPRDGNDTLAHELMHAIQFAYLGTDCLGQGSERLWMAEATATWVQQFAYPSSNREHGGVFSGRRYFGASDFLKTPEHELNFVNSRREYGAYLWFFHLAGQDNNAGPIRAAWEGIFDKTSLESIEAVLQSSGRGGFDQQWPSFALRNWNRIAELQKPYREYFQWDRLWHSAREAYLGPQTITTANNFATLIPVDHSLPPLSTRYQHYDFRSDTLTHQVWFENGYAGSDPRAAVWAIVKIKNRGWVQAEDWTDRDRVVLCRDKADENVEELILVISNRSHVPGPGILGGSGTVSSSPLTLILTPLPCNDWQGSAEFDNVETSGTFTRTTNATAAGVRFTFDPARSSHVYAYYAASTGIVDWTIVESGDSCATRTATGSFTPAGDLFIALGGATLYYSLIGNGPGSSQSIEVGCPGGPTEFQYYFSEWVPPSSPILTLANGATQIQGSEPFDPSGPSSNGWSWHFSKVP